MSRLLDLYAAEIRDGAIEADPAQRKVAERLQGLLDEIGEYRLARKSSALGWLFGRRRADKAAPRGLYIHGEVGRGKTMLMDLFFRAAEIEPRKRRVHFHAFMADVHARVHAWRQAKKAGAVKGEDPIAPVADALAQEAWLLCFDEFAVTDIADAMILGRLFTALFARGVVVVATSNVEPSRLYEGGLNRALFLPFIALLQQRMAVVELASRTDFRLEKLAGAPVWHVPANDAARAALDKAFKALSGHARGPRGEIVVMGRIVEVPQACNGVARFSFGELCGRALGAADYVELAREFHTIVLDDVPLMDIQNRNEARRFIWLVDALYDMHVKLVASAAAEPVALYRAREGREVFEFQRTESRLIEMRSTDYLGLPHGSGTSVASGDTSGLVET